MNTLRLTNETKLAAQILRNGGLVALPTETVYGLGGNGLDTQAVEHIFIAKGRPNDNPLILHIADADELARYCRDIPPVAYQLAAAFWPGALTMVLHRQEIVPDAVTAGLSTVAMRCPDHALTRQVIAQAGVPVAAPSANRSGKPSPTTAAHVLEDLDGKIDAVLDGGACEVGVESTILDLTVSPPHLLRPGGVSVEEIEACIGKIDTSYRTVSDAETPIAPGMKYRHYAPQAGMTLYLGAPERTAAEIRARAAEGDGILCFTEFVDSFSAFTVRSIGSVEKPEQQAHEIFDALRWLDRQRVRHIHAQCPNEQGVGRAVVNRMKKAAGGQIVEV